MSCKMNGIEMSPNRGGSTLDWFHHKCEAALKNSGLVRGIKKGAAPVDRVRGPRWHRTTDAEKSTILAQWSAGKNTSQIAKAVPQMLRPTIMIVLRRAGIDPLSRPCRPKSKAKEMRELLSDGMTRQQVAERTGCPMKRVNETARDLIAAGQLKGAA